jgi:hypothetical protein
MRNIVRRCAAAGLVLCASCTWFKTNPKVLVTSEPPGAHIFIDGHDSGETTPHVFNIAGNFGSDHDLELRKAGFRTERVHLYQYTEGYMSRWIHGGGSPEIPPLPLWWTAGDFVFPFGVKGAIVPGEVYVRMHRPDEPLLGFDLLAERARAGETPGGAK